MINFFKKSITFLVRWNLNILLILIPIFILGYLFSNILGQGKLAQIFSNLIYYFLFILVLFHIINESKLR